MQDAIRRLRLQARGFSRGKARKAARYSREFRTEVITVARKRRAEGLAVARIAGDLGIGTQTLTRWLRRLPRSPLRRIRVVAGSRPLAPVAATGLVLVAPGGFRVEGLDTDTVAQVLKSLA